MWVGGFLPPTTVGKIVGNFMYENIIFLDIIIMLLLGGRLCEVVSQGRQDLVTQFLVKITFLYKLVAKKLDFVLSKLQISIWKDRATVAW